MTSRTLRDQSNRPLLVAAVCAVIIAAIGGWLTQMTPWYHALAKPAWQPPGWLFGPAWALIFALIALAGARAWQATTTHVARRRIAGVFVLNAVFNIGWSLLFFRLQRPDWALVEVCGLWLSIIVLIWAVRPYAQGATWYLAPYLAWVSFAAVLNATIVWLNAPFTG